MFSTKTLLRGDLLVRKRGLGGKAKLFEPPAVYWTRSWRRRVEEWPCQNVYSAHQNKRTHNMAWRY